MRWLRALRSPLSAAGTPDHDRPDAARPAGVSRLRLMAIDSGWVAAGTIFSFFGTRGSGDLRLGRIPLDVLAYVLALAAPIALIVVRTYVVPVFVLEAALSATYLARDYPGGPIYLFLGASAFVLGHAVPQRRSLPLAAASALVMAVAGWAVSNDSGTARLLGGVLWIILPMVPWTVGALMHSNRAAAQRAAAEARRHQFDEERMRIARDVHDVVGHSLAVISMQAGVALHVADRRPEQARIALETIARSSREALADLRSTLAVFRGEDAPADPTPGLPDLRSLVADFTASGHRVDLQLGSEHERVPAAHALVVYRVVQESLTNAARYAAAAPTRVVVERTASSLRVEISDDGPHVDGERRRTTGTGLIGMQERCRALGGTLTAGPRPARGWQVRAELPLPAAGDDVSTATVSARSSP